MDASVDAISARSLYPSTQDPAPIGTSDPTPDTDGPDDAYSGFGGEVVSQDEFETIAPHEFNTGAYLIANPDVAEAVGRRELRSAYHHYVKFGQREGRVAYLPHTIVPRTALAVEPSDTLQGNVEAVIVSDDGALMVVGWMDDRTIQVEYLEVRFPDSAYVFAGDELFRTRREDAEQLLQISPSELGFASIAIQGTTGSWTHHCTVALWGPGAKLHFSVEIAPIRQTEAELRDTMLRHLAAAVFTGPPVARLFRQLGTGLGDAVVALNKRITAKYVDGAYVTTFGVPSKPIAASIIVCLYGKVEFLPLQAAAFSANHDIESYEFVYVCNSPELSDALLREAENAHRIYGLCYTIIVLPGNAGFGAANNLAARHARSDRLVILNPDVFPIDDGWASRHLRIVRAQVEGSRIFGALLYYDDGSLMHAGMTIEVDSVFGFYNGAPSKTDVLRVEHIGKGSPAYSTRHTTARPVAAVTGAFISVEKAWFEELGGFTEDFVFGHYEDADLCLKSAAKGEPVWLQDLRLWHLEGKGSTRLALHEGSGAVNRWLFTRHWPDQVEGALVARRTDGS